MKIWKDRCNDILRDDSGMGVVEIILIFCSSDRTCDYFSDKYKGCGILCF